MAEKRDRGRFTIRFDETDPNECIVIEELMKQKRAAHTFLTEAVLFYLTFKNQRSLTEKDLDAIATTLRPIMSQILAEQMHTISAQSLLLMPDPPVLEPSFDVVETMGKKQIGSFKDVFSKPKQSAQ